MAGCNGCTGSCLVACGSCSGCSSGGCNGDCSSSCGSDCTGRCMSDCSASCSGSCSEGCDGSCMYNCGGCGAACSGDCSSCSGLCSGNCMSTCSGDCNNACSAENQGTVIANLGSNILNKGFLLPNDFTQLRDAVHFELQRRGIAIPVDTYNVNPAQGVNVLVEHASKLYNNVFAMDATKDHRARAAQSRTIAKDDIDDAIDYIKILMAQNIK